MNVSGKSAECIRKVFTDNIFNLFSAKISDIAIQYLLRQETL